MAKLELAEYNFYMPVSLSPYFYFFNLPLIRSIKTTEKLKETYNALQNTCRFHPFAWDSPFTPSWFVSMNLGEFIETWIFCRK